jgi:hypothetical protein
MQRIRNACKVRLSNAAEAKGRGQYEKKKRRQHETDE